MTPSILTFSLYNSQPLPSRSRRTNTVTVGRIRPVTPVRCGAYRVATTHRYVEADVEMMRRSTDVRARIAIDGRVDREALAAIVSVLREGAR